MTALPGDRDVQTEAGRRLLDRLEKTWGVVHGHGPAIEVTHEDFTAAQIASILAIETEAYDAGLRVEAESVGGLEAADLRELREGVQQGTAALAIVYPVIQALRTWRDAKNTPKAPRAIQEAEQRVLTELQYFEDRAALALGSDK